MHAVSPYFCKHPKQESQLLNLYKFVPHEIYVELKGFNKSTDSIHRRDRLDKTASINLTGKSEWASRNGSFMDYDWWILLSLLAVREDCIKACSYYWQNLDIFMNPLWYHTNSPQNDFICPVAGPRSVCHIRFASNSGQLQLASPLIACLGPLEFHFLRHRHSPLLLLSGFFCLLSFFSSPSSSFYFVLFRTKANVLKDRSRLVLIEIMRVPFMLNTSACGRKQSNLAAPEARWEDLWGFVRVVFREHSDTDSPTKIFHIIWLGYNDNLYL